MAKRTFTNELGNEITIEVDRVGERFLRYRMLGPASETENTVTWNEAIVLMELIEEEA